MPPGTVKKGLSNVDWFVLAVLVVHILDAVISGFEWSSGWWGIRIFVYFLVLVYAWFIFHGGKEMPSFQLLGPTLLAVFLPLIRTYTDGYSSVLVWAVMLCFPVWFWYIYFFRHEDSKVARALGKPFLIFILVMGAYALLSANVAGNQVFVPGADVKDGMSVLKGFFIETPRMMVKSVVNWGGQIQHRLNSSLNINKFIGNVEEKEGEKIGVFIENVQVPDKNIEEGRPVVVWATLKGVSFDGVIKVKTRCYALKNGEFFASGTVTPETTFLGFNAQVPLDCQFTSLEAGSYKILFVSEFPFKTDGYVTYVLADQNVIWEYQRRGDNLGLEYKVPPIAKSVYTGGPVMLGMRDLSMPIGVVLDKNYPLSYGVLPKFGMTLDNGGFEGEIVTVNEFKLVSPKDVDFKNCVPEVIETVYKDNVNEYYFRPPTNIQFFSTITCDSFLVDPIGSFSDQGDVLYKTFLMSVDYTYRLTASTTVRVKDVI